MTVRTITSHVLNLHGAARVGDTVRFRLLDGMYTGAAHVPPDVQTATIDASGNISIVLYCPANYDCIIANAMRFQFTLPDSAVATTLEALHASGEASPTATNALQTLIDAHAAQADPHAVYLTQVEGDARYSLLAHTHTFASLTSLPTTLAGYGITDAYAKTAADARYAPIAVPFASLTGLPTTLAGHGITDAYTQAQVTTSLTLKANLASPTFTGNVTAPNLKLAVLDPSGAGYAFQPSLNSFEAGLYTDMTMNWGYNVSSTPGVKAVAGEVMLFWQMESKFRQGSGTPYGSEVHLNFARPTDTSIYNRPINLFLEHVSGLSFIDFVGRVRFVTSDTAVPRYEFPEVATGTTTFYDSGGLVLTLGTGVGGGTNSQIALVTGVQFPSIRFRNAAVSVSTFGTDLTNGLTTLDANGGFWIRNQTANRVALVVLQKAAQTADLFEVMASDQFTVFGGFNKNGYPFTRLNAAPADAELVAGQAMLWFDQTDGAGKLMVKAKTANGTVRTGSVTLS